MSRVRTGSLAFSTDRLGCARQGSFVLREVFRAGRRARSRAAGQRNLPPCTLVRAKWMPVGSSAMPDILMFDTICGELFTS